jgi:hypothetical protein
MTDLAIGFAIALAGGLTWRYERKRKPSPVAAGAVLSACAVVVSSLLGLYAFHVLFNADASGLIECHTARCGGSDAHPDSTPLRYWMLYGFHWMLGLVCSFVVFSSLVQVFNRLRNVS